MHLAHGLERHDNNFRVRVLVLFKEGLHLLSRHTGVANVALLCWICLAWGDKAQGSKRLAHAGRRHLDGREIAHRLGVKSSQFENVHEGPTAAIHIVNRFVIHSY